MAVDPAAPDLADAPVLTRIGGTGTNVLSYQLAQGETMRIETIAVDADATAAGGGTMAAQYLAPSGEVVAESSSASQLVGGTLSEVTFAPYLPDTSAVGAVAGESQLQTGLMDTELPGGSTVRIEATDAAVVLTEARLWATGALGSDAGAILPLAHRYLMPVATDLEEIFS